MELPKGTQHILVSCILLYFIYIYMCLYIYGVILPAFMQQTKSGDEWMYEYLYSETCL